MGAWGFEPWSDDLAADWFHHFFKGVNANARIRRAFRDRNDVPVIRAACFLLASLGRAGVWPGDLEELRQLLEQGIALLSRITKPSAEDRNNADFLEYWNDDPEFHRAVRSQIAPLRKRRAELQGGSARA
jgi:hypothetical protein